MSSSILYLADRVAVVTGGASGIGKACCIKLFALGCTIVVCDTNEESGNAFVKELESTAEKGNKAQAVFMKVDLSKADETLKFAKKVLDQFGVVHILVNNAGTQIIASIEEMSDETFRFMNELMLISPFVLTREFLPSMYEAKWGRILNIGSIHSLVAAPGKIAYTTIKHGLLGLTKGTAVEAGEHGVTVNCICPFHVRTPLVEEQTKEQAEQYNMSEDDVKDKVLLGDAAIKRFLESSEVAALCAFLCSEAANGMTGTEHRIDCGYTAK
ncbi:hypothetical protein INT43_008969 [Umbelopsis isabellina]|uniref:3-oxoacyl-[acyl-carrier-protein] reductase n=1 Tax=Mortierella isabellina TaxID=91625 RepID=A0A8H7UD99_MORIS|nr:hypothetical protein INT43_008969 [Umbelopsis isabellina]